MRWLDGSHVVPGVIPAPLLLRWYADVHIIYHIILYFHNSKTQYNEKITKYKDTAGFIFFFFVNFIKMI